LLRHVPVSKAKRLAEKFFLTPRYHYTSAADADKFMRGFQAQMKELCDVALKTGKPVAFGS